MRSRLILFTLSLYLTLSLLGCTSKPSTDSTTDTNNATDNQDATAKSGGNESKHKEAKEKKKEPVIVPAGTAVTVSLGSALGSKLSQSGQTFTGTVAKDVLVGNEVVIPKGSTVSGTVTDAKALGKFKGGALLNIRLDSINLNGYDMPVQTAARSFTEKGKGKRTAVMTGGGAALGGIIGALAGGGKGAAIGAAAGAGAGAGGSAFTGNKEIVLPAESDVSFELAQELKLERM
jgi:outer membrane lipoprotein SlyB